MVNGKNYATLRRTILAVLLFFVSFYISKNINSGSIGKAVFLFFSALFFLFFLFALIRLVFKVKHTHGFSDVFIGDEGGFSLSRLQAVLWAFVIVAYQLAVVFALMVNTKVPFALQYYELTFSEETLFLLGLSLGSYISVKGITVDKISKHPEMIKSRSPKISDIVVGDNGLDFSRIQMLIWTIIALFVFCTKVIFFLNSLLSVEAQNEFTALFSNSVDQFLESSEFEKSAGKGFLPYLPWSFLVLMGLSQGASVGKKMIPTFKMTDLRKNKEDELEVAVKNLNIKKGLLSNILAKSVVSNPTVTDLKSIENLKIEIAETQKKVDNLNKEIQLIAEYKI